MSWKRSPPSALTTPPDRTVNERDRLQEVYSAIDASRREQAKRDGANPGNILLVRERHAKLRKLLAMAAPDPSATTILEVGCGFGDQLEWLLSSGVGATRYVGVDVLEDRVRRATRLRERANFVCGDAQQLPIRNLGVQLVLCSTLFSSILSDSVAIAVASEVDRVLEPGGHLLWYDLRLTNPVDPKVRRYGRTGIQRLFPRYLIRLESIGLIPPLARRLGPSAGWLYRPLVAIPFLRSGYVGLFTKPA